ncbi:hypothetical protein BDQ12DRAFT_344312 [Crucibulum laeve]|uniref:Uncharacterized protein n=1 Tax=Crucibulum laeve TaxID=68775 RepID=A0A5C3M8W8_9AGAR|nr:hypothetical protein BDQ12DRAFT_344312 [Crucibulum laeve]
MAKTIPFASTDGAGSSKSSVRRSQRQAESTNRPRRKRCIAVPPNPRKRGPSAGLLSLLATIAASSSTVDGSPTPPPFLCPSLDTVNVPILQVDQPVIPVHPRIPRSANPSIPLRNIRRGVPDKFEQGDDGVWRKATAYTLYGSTVCPSCREPTNAVSSADDQMQSPADPQSSASSTPSYDIRDSLPQGWQPLEGSSEGRTTLILALSLSLAFFICFFIIGCLFWRKTIRRKRKDNKDVESRRRQRDVFTAEEEAKEIVEREAKIKQKIWARATARWKANARYSARQRRGKRAIASIRASQANHSTTSFEYSQSQDRLTTVQSSRSSSRCSSRRSSIDSLHEDGVADTTAGTLSVVDTEPLDVFPSISVNPPPSNSHASPPAYRQRHSIRPSDTDGLSNSPCDQTHHSPGLFASHVSSRRPSHSSIHPIPEPLNLRLDPEPYPSSLHAAHVATDDKTILARLADFASAPPGTDSSTTAESSAVQLSVPEWHDEELDDFHHASTSHNPIPRSRSCSPEPLFPLPPSKGKMVAPDFYEYPFTFEEMSALGPESEPSAPPFEEGISPINLPRLDDTTLIPSAPPLLDEDTPDSYPTAPEWNYPVHQHIDAEDAEKNAQPLHDSTADSEQQYITDTSDSLPPPPVQGPVSSDGIPPGYYP